MQRTDPFGTLRRQFNDIGVGYFLYRDTSGDRLLTAVVLFVFVRGDKDAAAGAFVRVIYVLPKDRVLVSEPTSELRVSVRGPWTNFRRPGH